MKKLCTLVYALLFLSLIVGIESAYTQDAPWVNQEDLMVDVKGTVQDTQGIPVAGASVRFVDPRTLFDPDFQPVSTVTDKDGKFLLKYNIADAFRHFLYAVSKENQLAGFASFTFELYEERSGVGYTPPEIKLDSNGKVVSTPVLAKEMLENIIIPLKESRVIAGQVIGSDDGEPVEGAFVGIRYRIAGEDNRYQYIDFPGTFTDSEGQFSFLALNRASERILSFHKEKGPGSKIDNGKFDGSIYLKKYTTRVRLVDQNTGKPRTDLWVRPDRVHTVSENNTTTPYYIVPDENGVATLPWILPAYSCVVFDPKSSQSDNNSSSKVHPGEIEITVKNHPTKVYGQIRFPDGRPAAGVRVVYKESLYRMRERGTDAYNQTWTDSQGRYEADIFAGIGSSNNIDTFSIYLFPDIPGWVPSQLPVGRFPANGNPFRFDVELRKPTVIRGVVTKNHLQQGKTPAPEVEMTLTGCLDSRWQMSGIGMQTEHWRQKTDEKGEFRFEVGPGYYSLQGDNRRIWTSQIDVNSQEEVVVDLEMNRNDMSGVVVDVSDNRKPVAGIVVGVPKRNKSFDFGYPYSTETSPLTITNANGKFQFEELNRNDTMFLAKGTTKDLYGLAIIGFDEPKENLEVEVAPMQKVSGRLIRAEDGTPLANYEVQVTAVQIRDSSLVGPTRTLDLRFPTSMTVKSKSIDAEGNLVGLTDTDGNFECTDLIYGVDYSLRLKPKDPDGLKVMCYFREEDEIHLFRVDKPEAVQLQDIFVPRSKYEPSGSQMHNATMVRSFHEDFAQAQKFAQKNNQNIVFLLINFNFVPHHLFLKTFYDDPDARTVSRNFQLLIRENRRFSDYDQERFVPVAEKLGLKPDDAKEPTLCILDAEGKLLEMVPFDSLLEESETDRRRDKTNPQKLIELLQKHLPK